MGPVDASAVGKTVFPPQAPLRWLPACFSQHSPSVYGKSPFSGGFSLGAVFRVDHKVAPESGK